MRPRIHFDRETLNDFSKAQELEWIETNGLGGYASSTVIGANTRRYHGLLVSSGEGLNRFVLLSKLEEFLIARGTRYNLSCNQYQETIHPGGHLLLSAFERYPFPTFLFDLEGVQLRKEIFMPHGEGTTVILYTLLTPGQACRLHIRPLIAFRDYHSLTRENPVLDHTVIMESGKVSLHPYPGMPTLTFHYRRGSFSGPSYWYRDFLYHRETERGLEDTEDLFSPGEFVLPLTNRHPAALVVTAGENDPSPAHILREQERRRREGFLGSLPTRNVITESLSLAADQFLIRNKGGESSVIAGYPWFTDWGRDAMISLNGLTLCTGRFREAREILSSYARRIRDGLIPNRTVEDGREADYHTADASLYFLMAVDRYLRVVQDGELLKELFPIMANIVRAYRRGTHFGIGMDSTDNLLYAGEPGLQVTWMDAKLEDWVVTPRQGKAVEINALWYHALHRMAAWSQVLDIRNDYSILAEKVRLNFNRRFWYAEGGYLYDVIDTDDGPDTSFRPNQVMALALSPPLVGQEQGRGLLKQVRQRLLTPFGLRSLAPEYPAYQKHYGGSPWERDSAYHQGTVWAWWMGPFVDACILYSPEEVKVSLLSPLLDQLGSYGVGTVGEIFDGAPPHRPCGCPAQAWSVSELLRSYLAVRNHLKSQAGTKRSVASP
jgi:predicted glycogen debranching enzyme